MNFLHPVLQPKSSENSKLTITNFPNKSNVWADSQHSTWEQVTDRVGNTVGDKVVDKWTKGRKLFILSSVPLFEAHTVSHELLERSIMKMWNKKLTASNSPSPLALFELGEIASCQPRASNGWVGRLWWPTVDCRRIHQCCQLVEDGRTYR